VCGEVKNRVVPFKGRRKSDAICLDCADANKWRDSHPRVIRDRRNEVLPVTEEEIEMVENAVYCELRESEWSLTLTF
jgi:hypothetical protein